MDYYSPLKKQLKNDIECYFFDSIDSTNSFLANTPFTTKPQLCIAREQTMGKGQYGRSWVSQKDGSIIFSIRKCFNVGINLNGLSLVVGMEINAFIKAFTN